MGIFKSEQFSWDDDNTELATTEWVAGKSATEIGKILGTSRNSVIGKLVRMGVTASARALPSIVEQKIRVVPASKRVVRTNIPLKVGPPRKEEKAPDGGITIFQLRLDTCRWPIGGTGETMRYCGGGCGEKVYCSTHSKIAYEPRANRQARDVVRGALRAAGR